jgi:site-specific DNA recombinase
MPPATTSRSPTDTPTVALGKRAFAYLRVSSDGQVNTDYDRDGLSISAQREAAADRATQLTAETVAEFSDPGKSAYVDLHKRTGFLEMLDELERCNEHASTRVDYVIVWSLSRWARNQKDYWQTRELVRQAGAQLVSVSEPMVGDGSAAAFFTESIIAAKNQYESMQTSENVKSSIYQKAKRGGTYGWTRLGYLNDVDKLPDGRRVSIAVPDPERHHFLTLAFQLYASGEYSIPQLEAELYRLGLRSRARKQRPPQKVNSSSLQRILRDSYYAGWIVYKRGTPEQEVFPGRHEALIDQATFDRTQVLLDEKRTAGERPQIHRHYLKGSVFCGSCGQRLSFGVSTGRNGRKYAYFFCSARINGTNCDMRANIRPELIEQAIQRHYVERPIQLTAQEVADRTGAIEALAHLSGQAVEQVRRAKTELIGKLQAQQKRLLRLHAEEGDDISGDAFREERQRLHDETAAAKQSLIETEQRLAIEAKHLKMALELAEDAARVYVAADETTKRGYNQAFFKKLYIIAEYDEAEGQTVARVNGDELTEPYAILLEKRLVPQLKRATRQLSSVNAEDDPSGPSTDGVSIFVKMAERAGFEPAMEFNPHTRLAGECLQPLGHLSLGLGGQCKACPAAMPPAVLVSRRTTRPSRRARGRGAWAR